MRSAAARLRAGHLQRPRPRGRGAHPAAGARARHRRDRQPAVPRGRADPDASRASRCPAGRPRSAAPSWAQLLLKFIVSHPAVTCAIPGDHARRPCAGEHGGRARPLPDAAMRARMVAHVEKLFVMSEWWTYSLSDFLLFSPRTYYRLFELYNAAIWPAQIVALGARARDPRADAGAAPPWSGRAVAAILAACWLWVAWAYLLERYATINWAARYFAIGLRAPGGCCCAWTGSIRDRLRFDLGATSPAGSASRSFLFALVIQPLIGPLSAGRGRRPRSSASRPTRPRSRRSACCSPPRGRAGSCWRCRCSGARSAGDAVDDGITRGTGRSRAGRPRGGACRMEGAGPSGKTHSHDPSGDG